MPYKCGCNLQAALIKRQDASSSGWLITSDQHFPSESRILIALKYLYNKSFIYQKSLGVQNTLHLVFTRFILFNLHWVDLLLLLK